MSSYKQGFYKPRNPLKYKGKSASNIVYRSGWEYKFMRYLDEHPDVVFWASEEPWFCIPYRDPTSGRQRRYFPDFWFQNKDGVQFLVEIKPYEQTIPPKQKLLKSGKPDKYTIKKLMTFAINTAKWEAARSVCEQKNWNFTILTEKQLKSLK